MPGPLSTPASPQLIPYYGVPEQIVTVVTTVAIAVLISFWKTSLLALKYVVPAAALLLVWGWISTGRIIPSPGELVEYSTCSVQCSTRCLQWCARASSEFNSRHGEHRQLPFGSDD